MSQEEFETTQVISALCFVLVKQGYSLDEIESGLHNVISVVEPDADLRLVDVQSVLDEYKQKMNELSDQADFYRKSKEKSV